MSPCVVRAEREAELAVGEHVGVVGEGDGSLCTLLDEKDCEARVPDLRERLEDDVDDLRRQPQRRLVEQQHRGIGGERSPDRQLLLLAARQRARVARAELVQDRKELIRAGQAVAVAPLPPAGETEAQVLRDRELAEDAAALGHERDPAPGHVLRPPLQERPPVEQHVAAARSEPSP